MKTVCNRCTIEDCDKCHSLDELREEAGVDIDDEVNTLSARDRNPELWRNNKTQG